MGLLERHLEQLLVNFPHLVSSSLWNRRFRVVREFGDVNVCVRQGRLPECSGRVDLAFVTESIVHLVELKRTTVDVESFNQLKRYIAPLERRYPDHLIIGYLAGRACQASPQLQEAIVGERVSLLIVGAQIPRVQDLLICSDCSAGYHFQYRSCPYCEIENHTAGKGF